MCSSSSSFEMKFSGGLVGLRVAEAKDCGVEKDDDTVAVNKRRRLSLFQHFMIHSLQLQNN